MTRSRPLWRAACLLPLLAPAFADPQPSRQEQWEALQRAWAEDHLKFAKELLKKGCVGFADTQAGLAAQLLEAEHADLQEHEETRKRSKPQGSAWQDTHWKEYESKRGLMHKKHATAAVPLLAEASGEPLDIEITRWILRLDPDQPKMRSLRGETKMPHLGWLPSESADPIRQGKVRIEGTWTKPPGKISGWKDAYEIPTEHFLVRSTLPLKEVLPLCGDLEALWKIWAEIFEGTSSLERVHAGLSAPPSVWILQTRPDYESCVTANIKGEIPNSTLSNGCGVHDPDTHQAFFFPEVDPSKTTTTFRGVLFHEASHLIHGLFKTKGGNAGPGFFVVEGAACLMEGLGAAKIVDWNASVDTAKHPTIKSLNFPKIQEDLPVALIDLDQRTFVSQENQPMLYAQSTALTHYLMYGHGGLHRRSCVKALQAAWETPKADSFKPAFQDADRKELVSSAKAYARLIQ